MSRKIIKIPLTTVAERLGRAMDYTIGMNHLAVLIHGWGKRHPDEAPTFSTLSMRKKKDGEAWLSRRELSDLSRYAGYDLSG